ncbi:hypothetical protein [Spirulina sp. 06S082]|nr:hypothetical protein [Spirulina sp. 06S082]MEA5471585.1 hypothetical protein [Spirulina sp. 06S082]
MMRLPFLKFASLFLHNKKPGEPGAIALIGKITRREAGAYFSRPVLAT